MKSTCLYSIEEIFYILLQHVLAEFKSTFLRTITRFYWIIVKGVYWAPYNATLAKPSIHNVTVSMIVCRPACVNRTNNENSKPTDSTIKKKKGHLHFTESKKGIFSEDTPYFL